MADQWNKKGGYWENTEDQKELGDFKQGKKEIEKMDRLLDAINNGDLSWNDLEGAKIVAVDERIVDNDYIAGLTVEVDGKKYSWAIIGEIQKKENGG